MDAQIVETTIKVYTTKDGWFQLDQSQRRLEAWVANLDDDPDERPLGVVRRVYEDACRAMADGFSEALVAAKWTVPTSLHQTRIYSEIVSGQPKPVAYFFVDAMRFEMGVELTDFQRRRNLACVLRSAPFPALLRLVWPPCSQEHLPDSV